MTEINRDFQQLHALGEYQANQPEKFTTHEKRLQNLIALAMQRRQFVTRDEIISIGAQPVPRERTFGPPVFLPGVRLETSWKEKEKAADRLLEAVNELERAQGELGDLYLSALIPDDTKARAKYERKYRALLERRDTYARCRKEHEQARGDFQTSTWKPESNGTITYYVRMNGQTWHFDVPRPEDPMSEEDFDLHEWLKWGLKPKRGRPLENENEPVWMSRDDREGLELRSYIRVNHEHMPRALARIARTLRVADERPLAVNQ